MTEREREYARWCAANDPHKFYTWGRWLQVREAVLQMDRHECLRCRERHRRYRRADTVHHVNRFKDRPELALEVYYGDPAGHGKRRNLISLCHECHEEAHGYRRGEGLEAEPLTAERWD